MLKWSMALAVLASLFGIAIGSYGWLSTQTEHQREGVRMARVQKQVLQQQLNLLQSPELSSMQKSLEEEIASLQIRLVEALTHRPLPSGVVAVDYEQLLLPQTLKSDVVSEDVSILRLNLKLTVLHSGGLLALLNRIDQSITAWPHETRACAIERFAEDRLTAQCVVDFYHWFPKSSGATAKSLG